MPRASLLLAIALAVNSFAVAQSPQPAAAPPASVATITFSNAVMQTNDAQKAFAALKQKYAPREAHLKSLSDEVDTLKKQLDATAEKLSDAERKELFDTTKATYDHQTDPRYGAARLWIDKIIDPMETRQTLITALEAAALNPEGKKFKVGVLQT